MRSLTLVDASQRDRFAPVTDWFEQAEQTRLPIIIYDHHMPSEVESSTEDSIETPSKPNIAPAVETDFPTAEAHIEAVGAATTLVAEALQQQGITITPFEATVMALGIHSDTGSLTFEQSTPRDAQALAWLMAQGANQQVIAEHNATGLSSQLQALLSRSLKIVETERVRGHHLGWIELETPGFVPGLSSLAEQLLPLLGLDTLLLCASYRPHPLKRQLCKAVVIGRSRTHPFMSDTSINLRPIFEAIGGGGHAQAASAVIRAEITEVTQEDDKNSCKAAFQTVISEMLEKVRSQIPAPITAKTLMSSPVRTILPTTSVDEAQRILLRYGHAGLCVVNDQAELVGIISRRDIDITLRHGLGHAPVKGCMSTSLKSIETETPIDQIQDLMRTYDIGRLPVLTSGKLVGIVTRTDLLRQIQQTSQDTQSPCKQPDSPQTSPIRPPAPTELYQQLKARIAEIWPALLLIANIAEQKGWSLYLVGGAVRDLLLSQLPAPQRQSHPLTDIDLVVDGAGEGAGVALAKAVQAQYHEVSIQIHGQFQTAALVWHPSDTDNQNDAKPLLIDIATARTEFYPYPAANPEVEASTIRQDLYRRDFTINAMAIKLSGTPGLLLDYFGGWIDLQKSHVRVLHANSFIEDPTRIFRAVRFAVRLGFTLDPQTEQFIGYAISSGIYEQVLSSASKTPALQTRLKAELKYLLSAEQWEASLTKIARLGALACLHRSLEMTPSLWRQLRRMNRWLNRFGNDHLANMPPRWLMLLELIIAQLDPDLRDRTAANLDLDTQSQQRLKHLNQWEEDLLKKLPKTQRPSQIYNLLNKYNQAELLLMSDRHPYTLGPQIWRYIMQLFCLPLPINGDTLKQLGYSPGPQFGNILKDVRRLTLDGELATAQDAESYILTHYPVR
ncbi:MAG: tRNA nucleotidyltransferase (CCA-adding enzyme) [Phormidesmis priestleyi Ana]|uniref:tRNA nucleotidyltransferase (CCA-adding enzyme) n=1 Tax=Phormidesmis priestleyi Ana TaxID=1666911 RepID=A0A0P8BUJ5_9CYAN|nr:MAG: tRNA nucleotidyltransferase (CCA-adding enzyme) [Phormidesmis priestleyi Ana]